MSNPFSYLRKYEELAPYFEAVQKILEGEYLPNLEKIKEQCLKKYESKIPFGDKGIENLPDAQIFFKLTSEQNLANSKKEESCSELSQQRKESLEKAFA